MLVRDGTSRCQAHKVLAGSFADKRRGSRQSRGYGREWVIKRAEILRRDHGICQPCLRDGHVHQGTHVDHVVPKAEGGSDDDANLQTICAARHRAKTAGEAARGRGGEKSGNFARGTDLVAKFLRAQDVGVGGVNQPVESVGQTPALEASR